MMSKCKPTSGTTLSALTGKGINMKDVLVNGIDRVIQIEVPYELLRTDVDVQKAFEDIIYIKTE